LTKVLKPELDVLCCFAIRVFLIGRDKYFGFNLTHTESPHAMDMSIVLEDKPVNVNEVPDYQEDIHTYLREMEVRLCSLQMAK
jgi:hypothetical protein